MNPKHPCGFCQGKPVQNAASWVDGKPRPPARCPRCGRLNLGERPVDRASGVVAAKRHEGLDEQLDDTVDRDS